jgi:hypothetical protein
MHIKPATPAGVNLADIIFLLLSRNPGTDSEEKTNRKSR